MKIHTCKSCGAKSDTSKFYAGVNQLCAECHKEKVRKNRADSVDRYRAYDANRFQNDPRVKERHKKYLSSQEGIASTRRAQRKWLLNNADKRAAHVILGNAVRDGRIHKSATCEDCGSSGRIHGHHDDYSLPLVVQWLCPKCHEARHKKEKA